jgi:hypothetical protein
MMRLGKAGSDYPFCASAREMNVQQAIPMQMREFAIALGKANAAEPMAAKVHARKLKNSSSEGLHRCKLFAMKHCRPR